MPRSRTRIRLNPDFLNVIAEMKISVLEFSRRAGVAAETIYGLLNPERHKVRVGGMRRHTAVKLIDAVAEQLHITREEAKKLTIIEEEITDDADQD